MPDAPAAADTPDTRLREHVAWLLEGGYAHQSLADAVAGLSREDAGRVPAGAAHSVWQVLRHIEICQRDLLDYSLTPGHESPPFPAGLWPAEATVPDGGSVTNCLATIEADRTQFAALLRDPTVDVLAPQTHIDGRTILRQALIACEHQSYHIGQIAVTRAMLDEDTA